MNNKKQLHLCCNQLKHYWEIMNKKNVVIFTGSLKQCQEYLNKYQ